MFDVARNLHAHLPAGQIESLLRSKLATCGRVVPDREIKAAIKNSIDFAWAPKGIPGASRYIPYSTTTSTATTAASGAGPTPPPKPDLEKIESLINGDDLRVADLWHQSPVMFSQPQTEEIIDRLFPGDPLLCCGSAAHSAQTLPRELWRGQLASLPLIVPSPMTALSAPNQDGKDSARCLNNTGPRRFLVVEFDFSEFARDGKTPTVYQPMLQRLKHKGITVQDMCANLLLRLDRVVPMTMAVFSGGKSIHGWWYCLGRHEDEVKQFHHYARSLGADGATWTRCQFIRMPDGLRDDGEPQPVYYFNPKTL